MSRAVILELAARHGLAADPLLEDWEEHAAIRQYLAGFMRQAAEHAAIGDVEAMHQIGLHCPETRRRATAGGDRTGLSKRWTSKP